MFWHVLLSGLAVALVRTSLQLLRASEYGDWPFLAFLKAGGFAAGTFGPLVSAYFLAAGMVSNTVVGQFLEAESIVDSVRTSLNDFFDELLFAAGGGDRVVYQELAGTTSRVVSFVHAWSKSLSLPVSESEAKYKEAHAHIDEAVRCAASYTKPAHQTFGRNILHVLSSFRNQISRIQSIRSTFVLAPVQRLAGALLAAVLLSIVVTESFVDKAPLADFLIAAVSSTSALLMSQLTLALDDPFCTPIDNVGAFYYVTRFLALFAGKSDTASPSAASGHRHHKHKKRGGGRGEGSKFSDTGSNAGDNSSDDDDLGGGGHFTSSVSPSPSSPSSPLSAPLRAFEREVAMMQITPAPLIAALRRRMRQLRK